MPSKFNVEFTDGKVIVTGDFNQDGEPSFTLIANATEIIDEIASLFKAKLFK